MKTELKTPHSSENWAASCDVDKTSRWCLNETETFSSSHDQTEHLNHKKQRNKTIGKRTSSVCKPQRSIFVPNGSHHIHIIWLLADLHIRRSYYSQHGCCWVSFSEHQIHPSEEHLKDNYITTPCDGGPDPKAPPDAPSFHCFWWTHRYDPSWPHIFQDSLSARKRRKNKKIVTSRGIDRHFRGPGRQKSWCKCKTSGDTTSWWG